MFTSRQALINFMEGQIGLSGSSLSILNYLATFTRGLNEPSIVPDPTRPLIQNPASNGGNDAYGLDNQINPAFPAVLVSGTFLRNDGTVAQIGQPLVNKRFALNRLAWLTYLGPSANRVVPRGQYNPVGTGNPGVNDPNYDIWALVNLYGIPLSYLQQGTAANIKKYFGLVWQVDTEPSARSGFPASFHDNEYKWFYQGHNETGQNTSGASNPANVSISANAGAISRLVDIAAVDGVYVTGANAREPDFFELLKATAAAGAKAKGAMSLTSILNSNLSTLHPYYYQTTLDASLDYAIIQLGANIIDQFKVDGYATRIVFNDGAGTPHEFRGSENLPYLYRFQSGTLKLRMENPILSGGSGEQDSPPVTLNDTGVAVVMHIPTIWNPYDANAPLGAPAAAGPGVSPLLATGSSNFRLIADSTDPNDLVSTTSPAGTAYTGFFASGVWHSTSSATSNARYLAAATNSYRTGPNGTGSPISPSVSLAEPPSPSALYPGDASLSFFVPNATLFREPTVLAMAGLPTGSNLQMAAPIGISQYAVIENSAGRPVYTGSSFLSDSPNPLDLPTSPSSSQGYVGICAALYPVEFPGNAVSTGSMGIYQSQNVALDNYDGVVDGPYITYRLQYKDPNPNDLPGSWVTYDEKYTQFDTLFLSTAFGNAYGNLSDQSDGAKGGDWQSYADPRTSRFAALNGPDYTTPVQTPGGSAESGEWSDPLNAVGVTDRPDINAGYAIACNRFTNDTEFGPLKAAGWTLGQYVFRSGLLSQNSMTADDNGIRFTDDSNINSLTAAGPTYYADPDGVVRGAMANYVQPGASAPAMTTVGLPLATSYPAGFSYTSGAYQAQSRPYILHRPFRSVAELGYVFSGTPWKNIDFFTPQSGDASMLDVFTINEPPSETVDPNELVAGVVNLNTRQTPVLQAVLAGASVDEVQSSGLANTGFPPLTAAQVNGLLTVKGTLVPSLLTRTGSKATGEGPLENVSELVGHWTAALNFGTNAASGYTGVSGDLGGLYSNIFGNGAVGLTMQNVDRFRESFIRPLAAVGNTRVWNVMIDLIAQTGQYQPGAATLDNFTVSSQHRYWLHEAIDRYTGQILDQSLEPVGPASLTLSGTSVTDNQPAGATVASLNASELLSGGTFAYSLVSGTGANDNASFTVSGNTLQTAAAFDALAKSSYNIVLRATDQAGFTYDQPVTVNVQPGPYTQWKIANFGANASNPAVAGDTVDAENDGLPNLLKYALGDSPSASCVSGITVVNNGATLTMNYSLASAATDVTVTASITSNVSGSPTWTTNGVTQTMLSDNGTTQQWQATAPVNGAPLLFMRLTVTRP
jgi:hypothetical protein